MGCRCTDISVLSRKISKLKSAGSKVSTVLSEMEETKTSLGNSADLYETGALFNGREKNTADSIKKGYDSSIDATENALTVINETINKYEIRLKSMKSEDRRYHERKRKSKKK